MSSIQRSAQILMDVLSMKNSDYTAGRGEFYNFEKTAEFVNVPVLKLVAAEVAKKMTRLDSLLRLEELGQLPNNESMKDTLLDLAGYAIIAHAYLSATEDDEACGRHPMCGCSDCD